MPPPQLSPTPPGETPWPGGRWLLPLSLFLLAMPIAALEWGEAQSARDMVETQATHAAQQYADRIASRLDAQFIELQFASVTLLGRGDGEGRPSPDPATVDALRDFMALHPDLAAFNVESADGRSTLWSTRDQAPPPSTPVRAFTPLRSNPELLLGPARMAPGLGGPIMTMRLRIRGANGTTRYFVGTPYRLDRLLASVDDFQGPWTLRCVDTRDGASLGAWRGGQLETLPGSAPARTETRVAVPGYPLRIDADWPSGYPGGVWRRSGTRRWGLEALLFGFAAALGLNLERARAQRRRLRRAERDAARIDLLTGLPNRESFERELHTWGAAHQGETQLAVMVLDLYQFHEFNRRWGREAGDAVLRELARRLRELPGLLGLARVGSDAFALAYGELPLDDVTSTMEAILGVFKEDFRVSGLQARRLTAALGCALYPADTAQAAGLLGLAEAALFNRAQRELGHVTTELDPYGELGAELLAWARRFIGRRVGAIVTAFYAHISHDSESRGLLALLDPDEADRLRRHQEAYLLQLLDPDLVSQWHIDRAMHIGRVHALLGVSSRSLVAATSWYEQTLTDLCQRIPGRLSQRQLLVRTIKRRLEIDLTLQSEAAQALQLDLHRSVQKLEQSLHAAQRWAEVMDAMVETLRRWPFIVFCAVYSQDAHGNMIVEAQSPGHDNFAGAISTALDETREQTVLARCWAHGYVETQARVRADGDGAEARLHGAGVRSLATIPLLDVQGRIVAAVMMFGRLPNQFDTAWMRDLLGNLRQSMSQVLQSMRQAPATRVSAAERALWRQRLFDGGLRMVAQPIVQLPGRQCTKVEALARLALPDGRVLGPGTFLPVLSDQELNRLFIEGLHQSLDALEQWQRDGVTLDLSFNLPPVTLRHVDCVQWIRAALERRNIDPRRITFELLENEDIADQETYTRAIFALHELGVQLAMDDLGSGYSSLLRLRTLPFDLVKIDQGLVRAAEQTPRRSIALVGALIRLAKGMDLRVAIEGLETDALVETAQVLGADLAQGYALARPMAIDAIPRWLRAHAAVADPQTTSTRMAALAAHWVWEQDAQDRADPDPTTAHRRCAVGRILARHGMDDSPVGAAHVAMHRNAQASGVHSPAYVEAREAFFEAFSTTDDAPAEAPLPS